MARGTEGGFLATRVEFGDEAGRPAAPKISRKLGFCGEGATDRGGFRGIRGISGRVVVGGGGGGGVGRGRLKRAVLGVVLKMVLRVVLGTMVGLKEGLGRSERAVRGSRRGS